MKYTYEQFLEIVETLRGEGGCPWDREQTHKSLRPCVIEEAAELVASIGIYEKTGNSENLKEELGDLLLQVVMHSQIAKEEGIFTIEDVINEIGMKMVRRHPHVFGDVIADNSSQVLENWEEIKKKEKEGKEWIASPLKEIPKELPALIRATKVIKKVGKEYDQKNTFEENIHALEEAVANLAKLKESDNITKEKLEKEVGKMLLHISDINGKYKLSGEQILIDEVEELIERFEK